MLKSLGVLLLVGVATSSVLADEGTPYGLESEDGGDPDNPSLLKEDRADLMEDEFIDQSDLFNYDPVTRTMRNKKERKDVIDMEVGSCQKKLEACDADLSDCKVGCKPQLASQPEGTVVSPCGGEQMFFRRFARSFIKMLITETEQDGIPLAAEVKVELNPYRWNKLRQFVQQKGKLKLVDAHDLMTDMLVGVHHDNIIESSWLERLTGMEWNDIKFYSLMVSLSIIVVVFESKTRATWWQQLCVVFIVLFVISVGWNWLYLYKKELSKRLAEAQKVQGIPSNCTPYNMSWWDSIKEVFRKQMTFQDDPCHIYHEKYLVDPVYEVSPMRALSHTVAIMILEPLQHMGRAIGEFHRELLKDLPYAAWIPAILFPYLSVVLVIVILYYCPSRGRRREDPRLHLVDRIQMLEGRLEDEKAINQRLQRVQALEMPRLQAQREYFEEPAAGLRPQSKGRRRNKSNSEPDLQHRQQQKSVALGRVENVHYQGDVSNGSSDEAESQLRHHRNPVTQERASSQRLAKSAPATKSGRRTTVVQGNPVESPISEVDSIDGTMAKPSKKPITIGRMDSQQARVEASGQIEASGSSGQTVASGAHHARNSGDGAGGDVVKEERITAEGASGKEVEAKVFHKEKSLKAPSTLTPSSSTDSETFLATPQGCDSPSSVSVIEGDSSPRSGGSVDGDSHLQGLGISLSGSIDVIEPQEVLEGQRVGNDDGQDSDEFEVLSREQCQTESMN
ncbi:chloride channel CLIC-like protein 1 isoform X2 [Asterias rubens]|uniref:chloride channel CLIC-like protein 1 isoform X2 n=1 Tax=Asterias rubens TaxID=7604 RepID=UPI001455674B|nr:chloride channel CLIC-like protein 1 isoform X2 [Asterias rubens]